MNVQQMIDRARAHDDKGKSEEMCIFCGWVMGQPPLNCLNDDSPHVFPSTLDEARAKARRNLEDAGIL